MIASTDLTEPESSSPWAQAASEAIGEAAPGQSKAEEFRALYDAHFKLVWGSLRRLGVREADTMDLAQKVFLTAFRKLDSFAGRSRITTWLVAICQRVASDYRRSASVRREVATDASELDAHAQHLGESPSPGADLLARDRVAVAEAILNKLPEAQRSVFVLYELEELPAPEIAEMLQISVGTVRSRLRLAREVFAREVKRLSLANSNFEEEP